MALSETKKMLIAGLKNILTNKDTITAIALLLKTDAQMKTMLDWIYKHHKENPSENLIIQIAKAISEEVHS